MITLRRAARATMPLRCRMGPRAPQSPGAGPEHPRTLELVLESLSVDLSRSQRPV